MSVARLLGLSLVYGFVLGTAACASGHAFPSAGGDPRTLINRAATAVDNAAAAGADTLAGDVMKIARQHLADAQIEWRDKHTERAALRARQTIADANYAKAQTERVVAERTRAAEEAQLHHVANPRAAPAAPAAPAGPGSAAPSGGR